MDPDQDAAAHFSLADSAGVKLEFLNRGRIDIGDIAAVSTRAGKIHSVDGPLLVYHHHVSDRLVEGIEVVVIVLHLPGLVPFEQLFEKGRDRQLPLGAFQISRLWISIEQRMAPRLVEMGVGLGAELHGGTGVVDLGSLPGFRLVVVAKSALLPHAAVVVIKRIAAVAPAVHVLLLGPKHAVIPGCGETVWNALVQVLPAGPIGLKEQVVADVNLAAVVEVGAVSILHDLPSLIVPGVLDD